MSVYNKVIAPNINYRNAQKAYEDGDYKNAIALLEQLGEYKEAPDLLKKSKYDLATAYLDEEKYSEAKEAFNELGNYEDSDKKKLEAETAIEYEEAVAQFNKGHYYGLLDIFKKHLSYKDSSYYAGYCYKEIGEDDLAVQCFEQVSEKSPYYEEAREAISECQANLKRLAEEEHYKQGIEYAEKGYVYSAKEEFELSNGYKDSKQYLETIDDILEEGWVGIYHTSDENADSGYLGIFCEIDDSFEKSYIAVFQGDMVEYVYTGSVPLKDGIMVVADTIDYSVDVDEDEKFVDTSNYRFQKKQNIYSRSSGGIRGFGRRPGTTTKEKKVLMHNKDGVSYSYRYVTSYLAGENKGSSKTTEGSNEYKRVGDEYEK